MTFEPEVYVRQIKKQDIIDFINQGNRTNAKGNDEYIQLCLEDFGVDDEN